MRNKARLEFAAPEAVGEPAREVALAVQEIDDEGGVDDFTAATDWGRARGDSIAMLNEIVALGCGLTRAEAVQGPAGDLDEAFLGVAGQPPGLGHGSAGFEKARRIASAPLPCASCLDCA